MARSLCALTAQARVHSGDRASDFLILNGLKPDGHERVRVQVLPGDRYPAQDSYEFNSAVAFELAAYVLAVLNARGHGPSAWSVSAMGRRTARRAGIPVSTATEISVPSIAVISHQAGGWLAFAPWLAAVNRP